MKKVIAFVWDIITMPIISAAILLHESREEHKEDYIRRAK